MSKDSAREILVVAVDSQEEFDIVDRGHFYRYPREGSFPKHEAQYLAVHRSKDAGPAGIEHIAKIQEYRIVKRNVLAREIVKYKPDYGKGDGTRLVKVVVGPLVRLHHRIINPKGRRISYRYTTFEKLLSAETVDDF